MSVTDMQQQLRQRQQQRVLELTHLWQTAHQVPGSPSLTPPTSTAKKAETFTKPAKGNGSGAENELRMLLRLRDCPRIVPLLDTYLDDAGNRVLVLKRFQEFPLHTLQSLEEVGRTFKQLFEVRLVFSSLFLFCF